MEGLLIYDTTGELLENVRYLREDCFVSKRMEKEKKNRRKGLGGDFKKENGSG